MTFKKINPPKPRVVKYYRLTPKVRRVLDAFHKQLKRDFPDGWWQKYQEELNKLKKRKEVGE